MTIAAILAALEQLAQATPAGLAIAAQVGAIVKTIATGMQIHDAPPDVQTQKLSEAQSALDQFFQTSDPAHLEALLARDLAPIVHNDPSPAEGSVHAPDLAGSQSGPGPDPKPVGA
jgi:hypothetical protein